MTPQTSLFLTTATALCVSLSPLPAERIPLLLDFGPTTPTLGNLTNSPYHTDTAAAYSTWNILGTSDSSGLLYGDGASATGVAVNLGVSPNNNVINFATQPGSFSALGVRTNTGVFSGDSVGKDAIFHGSNGQKNVIGLKITGLALDTYSVYVVGINTNLGNFGSNPGDSALIPMNIGALATADVGTLDISSLASTTVSNVVFDSWNDGLNYGHFEVTLTEANPVLTIFTFAQNASVGRGFLNAVQVVAIPEPGTLALVGIALGSLLLARRRK